MKTPTPEALAEAIRLHQLWLAGKDGGRRLVLDRANLRGADLSGADLRDAYLGGAALRDANLHRANLIEADLRRANLRGAKFLEGTIRSGGQIVQINPIDSEDGTLIAAQCEDGIRVQRGCYTGTLDEFARRVDDVHGDNRHGKIYRVVIEMLKIWGQEATA